KLSSLDDVVRNEIVTWQPFSNQSGRVVMSSQHGQEYDTLRSELSLLEKGVQDYATFELIIKALETRISQVQQRMLQLDELYKDRIVLQDIPKELRQKVSKRLGQYR